MNERYDVAICGYAGDEFDRTVLSRLHDWLQRVHIDEQFRRYLIAPARARLTVFQDTTVADASVQPRPEVVRILESTRKLIVVFTPRLLASPYCLSIVSCFSQARGRHNVLMLLAEGDAADMSALFPHAPNEAEPEPVPLAADVRAEGRKHVIRKLTRVWVARSVDDRYKLLAAVLECDSPDRLVERARRRFLRQVIGVGSGIVVLSSGLGVGLLRSRWADQVRRESLVALGGLDGVGELPSEREYQSLESLADLPIETRLAALERVLESEALGIRLVNRMQFVLHAILGLDVEVYAQVQRLIEHSAGRAREVVSSALDALQSSGDSSRPRATQRAPAPDDTLAHAAAPSPVDQGHRTRAEALARQMVLGRRSRLSRAFAQPDLPKVSLAFADASRFLSPEQAADVARLVLELLTTTALLKEFEALAEALGELAARMGVKDCIATLKAIPCVGQVRTRFLEGARDGVAPGISGNLLEVVRWAKSKGVEPSSVHRF